MARFKNVSLEISVIKTLLEPTTFWEYSNRLSIDMFTDKRRSYFERLAKAIEDDTQVSFANELSSDIDQVEQLDDALETLRGLHKLRLFADENQTSIDLMNKGTITPKELISKHVENVEKIRDSFEQKQSKNAVDYFHDAMARVKDRTEMREKGIKYGGMETGYAKFDSILDGIQAGLYMLAAPSHMGKSTLTLNVAQRVAAKGKPVLYVSYEEPPEKLALKSICIAAGISINRCMRGTAGQYSKLQKAFEEKGSFLKNIEFIWGTGETTPLFIKQQAKRLMKMHKTEEIFVVIDYLQNWAKQKERMDTTTAVSTLTLQAMDIAHSMKIPVWCISAQNRASQLSERSNGMLSFKDSGDIEYTMDVGMTLREGTHETTEPIKAIEWEVIKNRISGVKAKIALNFDTETGSFSEDGTEKPLY